MARPERPPEAEPEGRDPRAFGFPDLACPPPPSPEVVEQAHVDMWLKMSGHIANMRLAHRKMRAAYVIGNHLAFEAASMLLEHSLDGYEEAVLYFETLYGTGHLHVI